MSLFNRSDKSDDPVSKQPPAGAPPKSAAPQPAPSPVPQKPQTPPPSPVITKPNPTPTQAKTGASMASVISKALKITGELESTEDIQIDGQIEGDVRGVGVKIGQNAKVKGTVYGEEVELAGTIEGRIEAKKVFLAGTARMTGDVWHQDIRVESGAYINGNLKPELSKADNKPAAKPAAVSNVTPVTAATGTSHH
jgi:cytoskeletal protein CcmA (bactofilin family)